MNVTDAQLRALKAIASGQVTHHRPLRGTKVYWRTPQGVRKDTVERVIGMKLARLGPHHRLLIAYAELTEAGRAALLAARKKAA